MSCSVTSILGLLVNVVVVIVSIDDLLVPVGESGAVTGEMPQSSIVAMQAPLIISFRAHIVGVAQVILSAFFTVEVIAVDLPVPGVMTLSTYLLSITADNSSVSLMRSIIQSSEFRLPCFLRRTRCSGSQSW